MRAPLAKLLALLVATASCAEKYEGSPPFETPTVEPEPGAGASEAKEDRGDSPSSAPTETPVVADPEVALAPPAAKPETPADLKPPPANFHELNAIPGADLPARLPLSRHAPRGGELRDETAEQPPNAGPDALSKAIGGGWRDAAAGQPVVTAEEADADPDDDKAPTRKGGLLDRENERTADDEVDALFGLDTSEASRPRGALTVRTFDDPDLFTPPPSTLPRMFYFENTYLGGSAAYAERLRRLDQALQGESRPYEIVQAEVQPFDPPRSDGLGVVASIDATHFERARRVFLQVGLRGSSRYGWRRPPLDIVLVVDQPAFARGPGFITRFIVELLRQLGPSDRLGIVLAGQGTPTFLDLARLNSAQQHLANRIDELAAPGMLGARDLADAMSQAGRMLDAASDDEATVPGTKTIMVLSGESAAANISEAARAAHALTVEGCVTSVFALDSGQSEWWQVANAGYGNLHRISEHAFGHSLGEEMQSLARVVARLVRVNVRLGKDAKAIRVLGTRVLEQREVDEVKARELATDINLSKSLGITSNRGEDDDGIQTVIPYFYGDDSHVILIELWVEGPGTVADVTVRYKDMVNLDNATARTSVRLGARPQPPTHEQLLIARNVRGFELAENLQKASDAVYMNDFAGAVKTLGAASSMAEDTNALDQQAIEGLKSMVERGDWQNDAARRATLQETLLISGQRRVGDTNKVKK